MEKSIGQNQTTLTRSCTQGGHRSQGNIALANLLSMNLITGWWRAPSQSNIDPSESVKQVMDLYSKFNIDRLPSFRELNTTSHKSNNK